MICGGERPGCVPYRIVPITMQVVCSWTMALCLADRSGAPCRLHAFVSAVKNTDSTMTCYYGRHLQSWGDSVSKRTCFLMVQVLMNRGCLTGLIGDGVNDYAYTQENKRRYRCGLLRRDVAATCFQRRHLQSWVNSVSRQMGVHRDKKSGQGSYGSTRQDPCTG